MRTHVMAMALLFAGFESLAVAAGQQPASPTPTTAAADVMPCAQAQVVVDGLVGAASARLEAARQTNSAADMRRAVDALQGGLRDVRAQLAPCASLPPANAHAGHAMGSGSAGAVERTSEVIAWLKGYDAAFLAKDLTRLAAFYDPNVTIYEGIGVNTGWADYRDNHLGPELKAFDELEFGHTNHAVRMLGDRAAYVTSELFLKARMNAKPLDLVGRETLVVARDTQGTWKILHSHTATRARATGKN